MKWIFVSIIAVLWAGYAAGHDRKPVPRWYHPMIHLLYAALLVAVILWIT